MASRERDLRRESDFPRSTRALRRSTRRPAPEPRTVSMPGGITAFSPPDKMDLFTKGSDLPEWERSLFESRRRPGNHFDEVLHAVRFGDLTRFRRLSEDDTDAVEFYTELGRRWRMIREVGMRPLGVDLPEVYNSAARRAFREIPSAVLFDMIRSDISDEELVKAIRATTGQAVKSAVEEEFGRLAEFQIKHARQEMTGSPFRHLTDFASAELDEEAKRNLGLPEPSVPPRLTVALSDAFGFAEAGASDKLAEWSAEPSRWFMEEVFGPAMDSAAMEKLIEISEVVPRALDWAARKLSGQGDATAGQVIFSPLKDVSPEAYNVLSGTADAIKIYALDTFIIFGKVFKGLKLLRGLASVEDISEASRLARAAEGVVGPTRFERGVARFANVETAEKFVERGLRSKPVDRFIKWYMNTPVEGRGMGPMSRMSEMYGWRVKPEAWARLHHEAETVTDVRRILKEEALMLGPSGAQNVERLPFLAWHRPLRDTIEDGVRIGSFSIDSVPGKVLRGPLRMTWGTVLDPAHPNFERLLRRFGDYAWGVGRQSDDTARVVDTWVDRVLTATTRGRKGLAVREMTRFKNAAMRELAHRMGASGDEIEQALKAVADKHPQTMTRIREGVFGFRESPDGLRKVRMPFKKTQLDRTVNVPSYQDMLAFKREILRAMGSKKAKRLDAVAKVDEAILRVTVPMLKFWLARPGLGAKMGLEEGTNLAGHPEIGRWYRRQMFEQTMEDLSHLPIAGHPLRRYRGMADLASEGAELSPDVMFSNQRALYLYGERLSNDVARALSEVGDEFTDVLPHIWDEVLPGDAAFSGAWYHTVNHQILNDPLDTLLLEHWGQANMEEAARAWMMSPEGKSYLDDLPRLGRESTEQKLERILRLNIEDVQRNIPDELLPHVQGALHSGGKVGVEVFERLHTRGIHPSKVTGPKPVDMANVQDLRKFGLEPKDLSPSRIDEHYMQPGFRISGGIADALSRKPAWKAAFRRRKEQLRSINATRRRYGMEPIPDEILGKEANFFAHRETYRLDNPVEKARVDFWLKNFVLFTYAQNSFMKRWARMLVHNPGFVSRARHLVGVGDDIGFIQEDDNGNLVFQIPISNEFYKSVLDRALGRKGEPPKHFARFAIGLGWNANVSGTGAALSMPFEAFGKVALPPGMPFSAQVEPGFGPVLTIPVAALTSTRPKLDWLRNGILGGYESWDPDAGLWQNVFREASSSYARNLADGLLGASGDRRWASAVRDLVAWADLSEKDNPFDPEVWKKYETRARAWLAFKGLSQYLFPYSLTSPVFMEEKERLRELIDAEGWVVGHQKFLDEQDGKGWPLVAALSGAAPKDPETGSKLPPKFLLAPTGHAMKFHREHPEFFEQFPDVAGLFTYRRNDKFDPLQFRRQFQRGVRFGRDPMAVWLEMNIMAGTSEYFEDVVPELEALEEQGATNIPAVRADLIKKIDQKFPGTREFLDGWSTRQGHRQRAVEQLVEAVDHPLVRNKKGVEPLRIWLEQYQRVDRAVKDAGFAGLGEQNATLTMRQNLAQLYRDLQEEHDSAILERAYTYLFQPEIEGGL